MWFSSLFARSPRPRTGRKPVPKRLTLETLDGRCLPSTLGAGGAAAAPAGLVARLEYSHQEAFHVSGADAFTSITDTTSAGTVSGQASPLGNFTGTFSQNVGDYLVGTATFHFREGDLSLRYDLTLDPTTDVYHGTYRIIGGTGLLSQVTGHGTLDVTDGETGTFSTSGTIDHVPEVRIGGGPHLGVIP
jgi:hypothetical protein